MPPSNLHPMVAFFHIFMNSILVSFATGGKKTSISYFDTTEFANHLSAICEARGMTQKEIAEALNTRLEHLSKIERSKRTPSIDLAVALACYFLVSTDCRLMRKNHDMIDCRTRILDVVTRLAETVKSI